MCPDSKEEVRISAVLNTEDPKHKVQDSLEEQLHLFHTTTARKSSKKKKSKKTTVRANELDGRQWTAYSISVWRDIRKTSDEKHLEHPAMFPAMLVKRIIQCFTSSSDKMILDPFMGSGSTLVGACSLGKKGIGFEIYPEYIELATQRLATYHKNNRNDVPYVIHPHDARKLTSFIEPNSIDFCFTSPPYWNILTQKRTADNKDIRKYGDSEIDLGLIDSYSDFIRILGDIFVEVYKVLKAGKYCVINVMDLRKGNSFYPYHSDLARELEGRGYIFDDIIIWDRSHEYNNLRPLGYPAVFRINKVHEFLLIFQKPKSKKGHKGGSQKKA